MKTNAMQSLLRTGHVPAAREYLTKGQCAICKRIFVEEAMHRPHASFRRRGKALFAWAASSKRPDVARTHVRLRRSGKEPPARETASERHGIARTRDFAKEAKLLSHAGLCRTDQAAPARGPSSKRPGIVDMRVFVEEASYEPMEAAAALGLAISQVQFYNLPNTGASTTT